MFLNQYIEVFIFASFSANRQKYFVLFLGHMACEAMLHGKRNANSQTFVSKAKKVKRLNTSP